jgi:hypothetical protein
MSVSCQKATWPGGPGLLHLRHQKGADTGCPRQSNMVMRALDCLIFSPQARPRAVTTSIGGRLAMEGDLGSQLGEEPNARSQASFDRREGARWSS